MTGYYQRCTNPPRSRNNASTALRSLSTAAHLARELLRRRHHVGDHQGDGAGGVGGGDAVVGIFHGDANLRRDAKPRCRQQVEVGTRLAVDDVVAGQHRLEARADSGQRQVLIGGMPRRGGHDRHRTCGGLQRIEQFDRALLQRQSGLKNCPAIGLECPIDLGKREIRAIALRQHRLAFRPGQADHGMAQRNDVVGEAERTQRRDQAVEIDLFGVEQRSVHVEQDGADVPSRCHEAAPLGSAPRACAGNPGTGSRHHPWRASAGERIRPRTSTGPTGCRKIPCRSFRRRGGAEGSFPTDLS